jgi:hypothetical protein
MQPDARVTAARTLKKAVRSKIFIEVLRLEQITPRTR